MDGGLLQVVWHTGSRGGTEPEDSARSGLRIPGTQRRGENDDHADVAGAGAADEGKREGPGARSGEGGGTDAHPGARGVCTAAQAALWMGDTDGTGAHEQGVFFALVG